MNSFAYSELWYWWQKKLFFSNLGHALESKHNFLKIAFRFIMHSDLMIQKRKETQAFLWLAADSWVEEQNRASFH